MCGVDDRLAGAQTRLAVDELVVERERDPERRRLTVGVEHVAHERPPRRSTTASRPATGRRTAPARGRARRGSGAPRRARTGPGRYEPSTGGRQPATRTPGWPIGDLAGDRCRQRRQPPTIALEQLVPEMERHRARRCCVVITSAPAVTYDSCTRRTYSGPSINACADHNGWLNGAPMRASSRPVPPSSTVTDPSRHGTAARPDSLSVRRRPSQALREPRTSPELRVKPGLKGLPVAFLRPWACKHWSSA